MPSNEPGQIVVSDHPKVLAPVGFGSRGIRIESFDALCRFANMVSKSGLAPKAFQTPEAIGIAVQMGMELGLSPMSSLHHIAVINGKPSLYGDGLLGVCRSSGLFDETQFSETLEGEPGKPGWTATCTVCRKGGNPVTETFTWADAIRAGLTGNGVWKTYPQRMMKYRARGFALRDTFADVLCGFISAEEAQDMPRQVESVVVPADQRRTVSEKLGLPTQSQDDTDPPAPKTKAKAKPKTAPPPVDETPIQKTVGVDTDQPPDPDEEDGPLALVPSEVKDSLMGLKSTLALGIKERFGITTLKVVMGMSQEQLRSVQDAIDLAKRL